MPKVEYIEKTTFKKSATEGDFRRSTGTFYDKIHIVTNQEENTGIINIGHRYIVGKHQLEVYVDGQFKRAIEEVNGVDYGDYQEISPFQIQFLPNIIYEGDQLRLRITWGSYNPIVRPPSDLEANLHQLAYDMFGRSYYFEGYAMPSERTIGEITNADCPFPEIDKYRTWKIVENCTIENLLMGRRDDIRYLLFKETATVNSSMNIRLEGDQNFEGHDGDTLVLLFDGYAWRELSRSLNSL
jgi:hypothetical protein